MHVRHKTDDVISDACQCGQIRVLMDDKYPPGLNTFSRLDGVNKASIKCSRQRVSGDVEILI